MRQSVVQLEKFYASRLGRLAAIMVMRRLHHLWPSLEGRHVLGLGYAGPFINPYLDEAKSITLAMPAAQGAVVTRTKRGIISALVEEQRLPFSDASFDNVIMVHGAEEAADVDALLRELWRVTMPEGKIVMIAAHRKGLWAQFDKTPFGYGRPFSRGQLRRALEQAGFVPLLGAGVLYAPPMRVFAGPKLALAAERLGETIYPSLSGLIMVEAVKRLYAQQDRGQEQRVKARPLNGGPIPGIQPTPIEAPLKKNGAYTPRHNGSKSS